LIIDAVLQRVIHACHCFCKATGHSSYIDVYTAVDHFESMSNVRGMFAGLLDKKSLLIVSTRRKLRTLMLNWSRMIRY
jgi:hypothetical protein